MFEKEAESYATRECCMTCNNTNHFCKEKCECWTFAKKGAEFGYNKANEWHDLRKNPKDLPEPHTTVLDENGDKITYCGGGIWDVYSEYYEKDIGVEPPIAWCEIPKFEE